jgi:hypothetical protein
MEVKITISSALPASADQATTTIQIDSDGAAATAIRAQSSVPVSARGAAWAMRGIASPTEAETQDSNALPAGQAMVGSGIADIGEMRGVSPIQPPAELLRAAASIGAANAGPAPMLMGPDTGMTPGEPQQFLAAGAETAVMAAIGTPDQPAGAAPESDRMTPTEIIHQRLLEVGDQ